MIAARQGEPGCSTQKARPACGQAGPIASITRASEREAEARAVGAGVVEEADVEGSARQFLLRSLDIEQIARPCLDPHVVYLIASAQVQGDKARLTVGEAALESGLPRAIEEHDVIVVVLRQIVGGAVIGENLPVEPATAHVDPLRQVRTDIDLGGKWQFVADKADQRRLATIAVVLRARVGQGASTRNSISIASPLLLSRVRLTGASLAIAAMAAPAPVQCRRTESS